MGRPLFDRRRADRSPVRLPAGLKVVVRDESGARRTVMTQLVDVSSTGVGVEARRPIEEGEEVEVAGDLHAEGLDLRLDATARVVYCRETSPGVYRLGFRLVEAAFARAS